MAARGEQPAGRWRVRGRLWWIVALMLLLPGTITSQPPCEGKRGLDPRNARLQVLDIRIGTRAIVGRVKNGGNETALGVMIWVNYYIGRRGGLMAQQCIAVGDLSPGEERAFQAIPITEAGRSESFDSAPDAVGWR